MPAETGPAPLAPDPLAPAPLAPDALTPDARTLAGLASADPPPHPVLEFLCTAADAARLARLGPLAGRRAGRPKTTAIAMVWHDTAEGCLAGHGLALAQAGGLWRLERLVPGKAMWPPAVPAKPIAEAAKLEDLLALLPPEARGGTLAPVAAFTGRQREMPLRHAGEAARLIVLEGTLRGVLQESPACRLVLCGAPGAMAALASELADAMLLRVPTATLAAQAIAFARGTAPMPRRLGAPAVQPGETMADSFGAILAHLGDVILYWATQVPGAESAEPVHQMRVAVRRLRSALSVFRRAFPTPPPDWLQDLAARLKRLARVLGAGRDWDVFIAETGAAVQRAFPADPRIGQLLISATRRRDAAYAAIAAYFGPDTQAGRDWRELALTLALLPAREPWLEAQSGMIANDTADFAATALRRRLRHVLASGEDVSGLTADALHELRKQAKRLRYAIEFFAPLFPEKAVKKYLPRLETLQAEFGVLNDSAVACTLVSGLGGGEGRAFAAGVVHGFGAAASLRSVRRVQRGWRKFYRTEPFWD